jgi:hypothetical protein
MKKVLLYIWQLPQNLLALIWTGIFSLFHKKEEVTEFRGIKYIWFQKWSGAVSLGNYVLIGTFYKNRLDTMNHEYGHTCQSRKQGWFYLLLTGLPSGIWNLIDRILMRTCKDWTWQKSYKIYYSMPWEKKADEYGGVVRCKD